MREIDIVFNLLRAAVNGEEPVLGASPIDTHQWWSIFRLMQKNHMAGVTAQTVSQLPQEVKPAREVLIPWLAEREKIAARYRHQLEVQQDIISRMKSHGIDTLVLKGTHLAALYPTPEHREFGDLDLFFYDKHKEADTVARGEMRVDIDRDAHHHTKYDYRGVTVESHYDLVTSHFPPSNRSFNQLLKEHTPSANFEMLFLLRHMSIHFASSRITLRDCVDWYLLCRHLQGDIDWNMVQETIEHYGMAPFASVIDTIVERRFGHHIPLNFTTFTVTPDTIHRIEHDIVYGNDASTNHDDENLGRLWWKIRRHQANKWKQRMVYSDSPAALLLSSIVSHIRTPHSILHKM